MACAVRPTNAGNGLAKMDVQTGEVSTWHEPGAITGGVACFADSRMRAFISLLIRACNSHCNTSLAAAAWTDAAVSAGSVYSQG